MPRWRYRRRFDEQRVARAAFRTIETRHVQTRAEARSPGALLGPSNRPATPRHPKRTEEVRDADLERVGDFRHGLERHVLGAVLDALVVGHDRPERSATSACVRPASSRSSATAFLATYTTRVSA